MTIDFSLLKTIDFTNPDTLIFLSVFLVLFLAFLFTIIAVIVRVIRAIKRLISRVFKISGSESNKKEENDQLQQQEAKEPEPALKNKIVASGFVNNSVPDKKEPEAKEDIVKSQREKSEKSIEQDLSDLKSVGSTEEDSNHIVIPRAKRFQDNESKEHIGAPGQGPKIVGGDFVEKAGDAKKEPDKNTPESQREKSAEDIAEELSKIKPADLTGQGSLASKMPSRTDTVGFGKTAFTTDHGNIGPTKALENGIIGSISGRLDIANKTQVSGGETMYSKNTDQSIFAGGSEVSKTKLKDEFKKNPNIWKAARQEGLNLSPVERSKLVEKIFPSLLGRNISKTDLKWTIKKLDQKMIGTKDQASHAKIRKEIKFLKKIGGIK